MNVRQPSLHGPLERRQEPRAQLAAAEVGLAGVAPALGLGVAGEVLGAGQHRRRVVQPVALVAADHRRAQLADEERVLPERLVHPTPAQVAGDAQDRRERPVDPRRGDLHRRRARGPLDQRRVPRARHRQLGREDGRPRPERVAVDAVVRGRAAGSPVGCRPRGRSPRPSAARRAGANRRAGVEIRSSRSARFASSCIICPTFSGTVIRPSRSSSRTSIGDDASW